MPDPIYSNVVTIAQLAIMLLIPLEILLAAVLRIKADYEMRDTHRHDGDQRGKHLPVGSIGLALRCRSAVCLCPSAFRLFPLRGGLSSSCSCSRIAAITGGTGSVIARGGFGPRTWCITRANTTTCRSICGRAGRRSSVASLC